MKGPAFNIGLHRAVGAWAAVPLLLSALTGLPNAFDALHDAIVSLDGHPRAKLASAPPVDAHAVYIPLAAAWQTISRLTPNAREVLIHVARRPTDPLEIYIIEANAPHANARTYLYLDAWSGRVLSYVPYSEMGGGSRLYFWMLSLHTGAIGGPLGQLILFLGTVGALTLGYTGISAYLRRRLKLDRKRSAPPRAAKPISP
jgi:vanillate O-demethylase ferredoxin subunit